MSSINNFPTFYYSQPDDYHFSHDSVFLAREIYEKHRADLNNEIQILDLCSGCGIVGLDFLYHHLKAKNEFLGQIDFIENQTLYEAHFNKNCTVVQDLYPEAKLKLNWINKSYCDIETDKKYDLIISNPPYFLSHQGKMSPNEFKNRCRFFIDADWKNLVDFIFKSLAKNGKAYFLVRDELKNIMQKSGFLLVENMSFDFKIRGTWVAKIIKKDNEV